MPLALPGQAAAADRSAPAHGWAVVESGNPNARARLLHFPPRRGAGMDNPLPDGSVRPAVDLSIQPDRIAAVGDEVLLVFGRERGRDHRFIRRVASLRVRRGPVDGLWSSDPQGRLEARPSLPGRGELIGFAGTPYGAAALIEPAGGAELPVLWLLYRNRWVEVALPWAVRNGASTAGRLHLVARPEGITLLDTRHEGGGMWTGRLDGAALAPAESEPGGPVRPEWEWRPVPLPEPAPGAAPPPEGEIHAVAGNLVYAVRGDDGLLELWTVSPTGTFQLARVPGVGDPYALAALEAMERIAIVWSEPIGQPGSAPASEAADGRRATPLRHRVAEVSVLTGQVMYDGWARPTSPVSARDFQLLALMLVGVMMVILLFVLRPDAGPASFSLPRGLALAEPGRRVAAGLIDALPAAILALRLTGVEVRDVLSVSAFVSDERALWTVLTLLGLGFVHCTLGEWLFGQSLGKALVGCEVVSVGVSRKVDGSVLPVASRVLLWQAAVRNLIRWGLPPLAWEGLSNPARRHRGDLLARTTVVIRVEPQDDEPAES